MQSLQMRFSKFYSCNFRGKNYQSFPPAGLLVNFGGILMLLFLVLILYILHKPEWMRKKAEVSRKLAPDKTNEKSRIIDANKLLPEPMELSEKSATDKTFEKSPAFDTKLLREKSARSMDEESLRLRTESTD